MFDEVTRDEFLDAIQNEDEPVTFRGTEPDHLEVYDFHGNLFAKMCRSDVNHSFTYYLR